MSKILSTILAGAAVLALSSGAYAAEDKARDSGQTPQNQTQGAPVDQAGKDVNAEGRDSSRDANQGQANGTVKEGNEDVATEGRDPRKEEFQAEMKKCDALTGERKMACTDAARKKHNQM